MSAASTLGRRKVRKPRPAKMTYHPSLVPSEESLTRDANPREQEVESARTALANPERGASVG